MAIFRAHLQDRTLFAADVATQPAFLMLISGATSKLDGSVRPSAARMELDHGPLALPLPVLRTVRGQGLQVAAVLRDPGRGGAGERCVLRRERGGHGGRVGADSRLVHVVAAVEDVAVGACRADDGPRVAGHARQQLARRHGRQEVARVVDRCALPSCILRDVLGPAREPAVGFVQRMVIVLGFVGSGRR